MRKHKQTRQLLEDYVTRSGNLTALCDTSLESMTRAITQLTPLVDSTYGETQTAIDNATSELMWCRNYIMRRMAELGIVATVDINSAYPVQLIPPAKDD